MTQFNNGCAPQADTKTPEKVYTREEVLLQREACITGIMGVGYARSSAELFAKRKFPLPTKIVPRVLVGVADRPEYNYCIIDGKVQVRTNNGSILNAGWTSTIFSAEDFKRFGELAASPTCEVEVDA